MPHRLPSEHRAELGADLEAKGPGGPSDRARPVE